MELLFALTGVAIGVTAICGKGLIYQCLVYWLFHVPPAV